MATQRELYRSPNGDSWSLARDPQTKHGFIIHVPNAASGGRTSRIELRDFLFHSTGAPEHQALLRLIGSLVDPNSPDESAPRSVAQNKDESR